MKKYVDAVCEELFKNKEQAKIEEIFKNLDINVVYVVREINKIDDYKKEFILPASKDITYLKAYLLKDINLNLKTKDVVFGYGGDVTSISKVISSKSIKYLYNPFSTKLAFDEGNANVAKQLSKKIMININNYRQDAHTKARIVKQSFYVYNMCVKKKVDFFVCSYAKKVDEIVDPEIKISFLKMFDVPETLSKRLLKERL